MNVEITIQEGTGVKSLLIDGAVVGVFDKLCGENYSFFSRREDSLTGDHYIEIGKALNKINSDDK